MLNKIVTKPRTVEWQGDPVMPTEWSGIYEAGRITELPLVDSTPMSTAIFRTYTSEGFVIAADGLRRRGSDGPIVRKYVQKIFPVEDAHRALAYGLAGLVYMGDNETPVFDFAIETARAASVLTPRAPADLTRYAELLSGLVNDSLREARISERLPEYPTCPEVEPTNEPGSKIAELFLVGYYEGRASWTDVRFWHKNQELRTPQIYSERLRRGQLKICGSHIVSDLLYKTNDSRLAAFRGRASARQEDLTLPEAVRVAENYIRACDSDVGREVDPNCASIGGHIHMATITLTDGFQWVPGFEPSTRND
jgi:hypothetical protein